MYNLIHKLRHQFTQHNLAKALGVSRQSVVNWEKKIYYPSKMVQPKIEKLYQKTFNQVVK